MGTLLMSMPFSPMIKISQYFQFCYSSKWYDAEEQTKLTGKAKESGSSNRETNENDSRTAKNNRKTEIFAGKE